MHMPPPPLRRTLLLLLPLAAALRVDQLVVNQGLCGSRAAAKSAIEKGLVTTRRGTVLRKASGSIDEATELVLHKEPPAAALASQPVAPAEEAKVLGDGDLMAPVAPPPRVQSASARAAARFNAKSKHSNAFGMGGNANGLSGRGKGKGAESMFDKPKHYSKKNKRGTSHYHES